MSNFLELARWLRERDLEHLARLARNHHDITDIDSLRSYASRETIQGASPADMSKLRTAMRVGEGWQQLDPPSTVQQRKDAPVVNPAKRGKLHLAIEAGRPENRQKARDEMMQDIFARSSQGPRESKWNTWCLIAEAWGHEPTPITRELAIDMASAFKKGQYRSARQYFHRAKEEHVEVTHNEVPAHIERLISQVTRSTERGIGPANFKDSFQVELLRAAVGHGELRTILPSFLEETTEAQVDMVILGSWWLTRGIELAAAKAVHFWTELPSKTAFWTLPVHKTDSQGMCVTRPHHCCCSNGQLSGWEPLCPFHAGVRHLTRLWQAFPMSESWEELPLFPDRHGEHMAKPLVIKILRSVIALTGTALTRPGPAGDEWDRFGEHVLRVSGAQMMARAGLELFVIQLIGRWASDAIARYVQEAHLWGKKNIANDVVKGLVSEATEVSKAQASVGQMTSADVLQLIEKTVHDIMSASRRYIGNPDTNAAHLPAIAEDRVQSVYWHAACGWPYGRRNHIGLNKLSEPWHLCKKCQKAKAYYNQIDGEDE